MNLTRTFTLICAAAAAPTLLAAPAPNPVDAAFVAKVSQGGAYEVAASKLAVARATSPDVKDLAISEVHDHEGVGMRLKQVSADEGIRIAPEPTEEFKQRLAKLAATPAAGFEAAYIADMDSIHDKDEKLFAAEAQEGTPAFKTFAHQTDLIVKRHIGALHGLDH